MRRVAKATAACLLAASLAGTLAAGAAPAQPAAAAKPGDLVTLNFMNAELDAVVRAIGQFTGKTFLVDPRVKGTLNLISEKPVTRDIAYHTLLSALRLQGYAVVESDGLLKVVPEADAKLQGGAIQAGNAPSGRGDQLVTQVFRLNYESANNLVAVLRPLIAPNNTINATPGSNALDRKSVV
jgi:general secretion pathway protein D